MIIDQPTYIISELSGEVVDFVKKFRALHNPERLSWPTDITLVGSSGVGVLEYGQELEEIVTVLSPIFSNMPKQEITFKEIGNFPNTGVYYLFPKRTFFDSLHKEIIRTNLKFKESLFPYTPHCTLKDATPTSDDYSFSKIDFPRKAEIECFSIYQPYNGSGVRLHRFEQGGGDNV